MSRAGLVGLILMLGVVAYVLAGSMAVSDHSCEVCMEYRGNTQCRTVAAATIDLARDGAVQNACAFISGGVTESMACHRETPKSVACQ
jgi:L-amino acid N-acyltransferase YncA